MRLHHGADWIEVAYLRKRRRRFSSICLFPQPTLPEQKNRPSGFLKFLSRSRVARSIASDLSRPVFTIQLWDASAPHAIVAVPETAIDENNPFSAGENEVRAPRQVGPVQAITVALRVEQPANQHLGSSVLALDRLRRLTPDQRAGGNRRAAPLEGLMHLGTLRRGYVQ